MAYCSKCGKKLPEDANFCPNCGVRTQKGFEAGAGYPTEEIRDAFAKAGEQMEKAFRTAAKEIGDAFKTARDNIRQSTSKDSLECSNCGTKNPVSSNFCYKCGKKLTQK
jgi:predicted amidophosphoribosyltransferase